MSSVLAGVAIRIVSPCTVVDVFCDHTSHGTQIVSTHSAFDQLLAQIRQFRESGIELSLDL
jgi:hypothetical protein